MPYKRKGRVIYVKRKGRWKKKSTHKSAALAKKGIRLLRAIKHGWKPTKRK